VALIDDGQRWRDHRYLVFEHRIPGDEATVVVTCALVNRVKTHLTKERFKNLVVELAKVFDSGTFNERAFPEGNHATAAASAVPIASGVMSVRRPP
jgi:hypothetical protein